MDFTFMTPLEAMDLIWEKIRLINSLTPIPQPLPEYFPNREKVQLFQQGKGGHAYTIYSDLLQNIINNESRGPLLTWDAFTNSCSIPPPGVYRKEECGQILTAPPWRLLQLYANPSGPHLITYWEMIQLQPWAKPFTLWWELLNLAIAYYAEKYDPPDQIYRIRHITIPEEWL